VEPGLPASGRPGRPSRILSVSPRGPVSGPPPYSAHGRIRPRLFEDEVGGSGTFGFAARVPPVPVRTWARHRYPRFLGGRGSVQRGTTWASRTRRNSGHGGTVIGGPIRRRGRGDFAGPAGYRRGGFAESRGDDQRPRPGPTAKADRPRRGVHPSGEELRRDMKRMELKQLRGKARRSGSVFAPAAMRKREFSGGSHDRHFVCPDRGSSA